MAELVPGGEKDSVVYLGKSSFKMKVGVRMTPPAGTAPTVPPAQRVAQTPHTPRPALKTSRPPSAQSSSPSRPGVAPKARWSAGRGWPWPRARSSACASQHFRAASCARSRSTGIGRARAPNASATSPGRRTPRPRPIRSSKPRRGPAPVRPPPPRMWCLCRPTARSSPPPTRLSPWIPLLCRPLQCRPPPCRRHRRRPWLRRHRRARVPWSPPRLPRAPRLPPDSRRRKGRTVVRKRPGPATAAANTPSVVADRDLDRPVRRLTLRRPVDGRRVR